MFTRHKLLLIAALTLSFPAATLLAGENFEGQDLKEKDFTGKNLTEANFLDATVQRCNFTRAILNKANFEDADLRWCSFYQASAQEANFKGAIFLGRLSNMDLQKAIFTGVDFKNSEFERVNLRGADMRNTTGYGSSAHVNFRGADLRGANLSGLSPRGNFELQFKGAKYDRKTVFPKDTDPQAEGAVLVEE